MVAKNRKKLLTYGAGGASIAVMSKKQATAPGRKAGKASAPPAIRKTANLLRNSGYSATVHFEGGNENRPGILIPGRGRYEIVSEGDRGYRWRNDAGTLSGDIFTCDLYLLDDDGVDEVADALIHMLEDE